MCRIGSNQQLHDNADLPLRGIYHPPRRLPRLFLADGKFMVSTRKELSVMISATRFAMILAMSLIPALSRAQDFSADVVYLSAAGAAALPSGTDVSGHNASKLYVSNDKMRLETHGLIGTILLVNRDEDSAYAVFPSRKEYEPLAGGLSEYFSVKDAENACPDWQKAAGQQISCEKVGYEVTGGRQTVKYKNKNASDFATSAVWIDSALKFVVKWEGAGTSAELRNVQEGQQAANLFTLPSGYGTVQPRKSANNKGFSK